MKNKKTKVTADQVAIAKKQFDDSIARYHELNDQFRAESVVPQMRKNIGRCFKYSKSYGSSNPAERWWIYARIVGVEDGRYRNSVVEKDFRGKVEAGIDDMTRPMRGLEIQGGWTEIKPIEFFRAAKNAMQHLKQILL